MTKKVKFVEFDVFLAQQLRNPVCRMWFREARLRRNILKNVENMLANHGASMKYLMRRIRESYKIDKIQRECVLFLERGYPLHTSTLVAVADCLGYDVEITFKKRKQDR